MKDPQEKSLPADRDPISGRRVSDEMRKLVESLREACVTGDGFVERDALLSKIARLEDDSASSWECLDMVSETLKVFLGPDPIAPMFFPEAIRSAMFRAQRGDYLPKPTPECPPVLSETPK